MAEERMRRRTSGRIDRAALLFLRDVSIPLFAIKMAVLSRSSCLSRKSTGYPGAWRSIAVVASLSEKRKNQQKQVW
jgi:hypothetical protein